MAAAPGRATAGSRSRAIADPGVRAHRHRLSVQGDLAGSTSTSASSRRVAARTSGIRRPGSAALDLADVAAGRFDGFWEQHLSAWDIAAGMLLVREAGGVVTDFAGRDVGVEHTGVVAGNPAMHAWLLEMLSAGEQIVLTTRPAAMCSDEAALTQTPEQR